MNSLFVLEPGMLTSVQGPGFRHHLSIGVPEGGAADPLSLVVGNRLLGNWDRAAALECTLTGPAVRLESDALIAITGGDARVQLETDTIRALEHWKPHRVRPGEIVRIGPITRGCRSYLCIAGGIAAARTQFGASTNLRAGFGGHHGRALRARDRLHFDPGELLPAASVPNPDVFANELLDRRSLRVVRLPLGKNFGPESAELLWSSEFTVSNHSDRAGIRLDGPAIPSRCAGRMTSEGMPPGAIQIPENGQPIILGVDHPTTGGYPVLACVASVDLPVLGQLRPREKVRFEPVSVIDAHRLLAARAQRLREFPRRVGPIR